MLSMTREAKPGHWQTVGGKEKKKKQEEKKETKKDRLGVSIASTSAAFAAFDKSFVDKAAAERQKQEQSYKGAFTGLVDEAPPQALHDDESSGDEASSATPAPAAAASKPKAPKAPKKPKLTVAQVAAGVDLASLQVWMSEVQQRYSVNETAQLEALSDKLLGAFKEATFDLGKLLATKGLDAATAQPLSEVPENLLNVLSNFVGSVSEDALAAMTVPLTTAVINEAAGGSNGITPAGKGKAGLQVMLAVILRTCPQALVLAAPELRAAGRQLSGIGRLPVLLWVINQAAKVDAGVGVAVWVRLLLPQLLGLPELPGSSASASSSSAAAAAGKGANGITPAGLADDLMRPLEVPLQAPAVEYLSSLLEQIDAAGGAVSAAGGDIVRGDGDIEPTVPASAVELLSRLVAGKPNVAAAAAAGGGAGAAAAAAAEGKKAATARAAAAVGLAPMLPGLTALAASTSCLKQYSVWLLLALESAALSSADPDTPDELVQRSASNMVACICGSDACFGLWESKHKGSLRGSARVLATMLQQPQLLRPLQQQPEATAAFRDLLAALPARHRSHLATGKGWQGACARVAEDACQKLPKKLGRGWRNAKGAKGSASSGGGSRLGTISVIFGATTALAGVVVMAGLYRREVAGVVQAYAGKEAAERLDAQVLVPVEAALQQLQEVAGPHLAQLQAAAAPAVEQARAAAAPLLSQAWEVMGPVATQVQTQVVGPALRELEHVVSYASQQLQEMLEKAKTQ